MGYLKRYPNAAIPVDGSFLPSSTTDEFEFQRANDWTEVFPDAHEACPIHAPRPFFAKDPLKVTCYVDADHACNTLTKRSVTGILLLINNTPLVWISRWQTTVKTSTFGSKIIAARTAIDLIIEIRYKLRCLGLQIERSSTLVGDNQSVILNTTSPASKVKKKHLLCQIMRV